MSDFTLSEEMADMCLHTKGDASIGKLPKQGWAIHFKVFAVEPVKLE